jgi:hypothetical protein
MSEHHERADDLEREADEMEKRVERLGDETDQVSEDWERKKRDPGVPGAVGDPQKRENGPQPETNYPSKGDEE